jgi:hypothetical protein
VALLLMMMKRRCQRGQRTLHGHIGRRRDWFQIHRARGRRMGAGADTGTAYTATTG